MSRPTSAPMTALPSRWRPAPGGCLTCGVGPLVAQRGPLQPTATKGPGAIPQKDDTGAFFRSLSQPGQAPRHTRRPPASGPGTPAPPPPWRCGYAPPSHSPGTGMAWPLPQARSGNDRIRIPFQSIPLCFSLKTVYHP